MSDDTLNPEAIRADMEAGTLGPFEACDPGDYSDYNGRSVVVLGEDIRIVVVLGEHEEAKANARRIARLPDLEQGYLDMRARAEAAEAWLAEVEAERDEAVTALTSLERRATRVSDKGASTGPQWTQLTIGLLAARTVLKKLSSPSSETDRAALTDTQEEWGDD